MMCAHMTHGHPCHGLAHIKAHIRDRKDLLPRKLLAHSSSNIIARQSALPETARGAGVEALDVCIARLICLRNPGRRPLAMQAVGDVLAELHLQAGLNAHAQGSLLAGSERRRGS